MDKVKKYKEFLEGLKGNGNDALIESIKTGFSTCVESLFGIEPLTPAYGRDYKFIGDVQKEFDADKDFMTSSGQLINKPQVLELLEKEGRDSIQVRFNQLEDTGVVKATPTEKPAEAPDAPESGLSAEVANEIKLKNGETIPKGEKVHIEFVDGGMGVTINSPSLGRKVKISTSGAYRFFNEFSKMPDVNEVEEMMFDGIVGTPTGHEVEPDGYGPDGSPSWLILMGVI